jgi:glycogen debranching enzyme
LNLIHAENKLWSPYGLRSLSRDSPLYGSAENYWRGPIWININYLVIEQLLVSIVTSGLPFFRLFTLVSIWSLFDRLSNTNNITGISAFAKPLPSKSPHYIC